MNLKLEDLLRKNYNKLNENDIYIWHFIQANKKKCCQYTIEDLARKCNVSRSTILRFAQKLEFSGFSELKVRLKIEGEQYDVFPDKNVVDDICNNYNRIINDMRSKDFSKICKMIHEANRVFLCGSGSVQSFVAQEMKRSFIFVNKCMYHIDGRSDEMHAVSKLLNEDDVVILISLSGETPHIINFAKEVKLKNTKLISFTRMNSNTLADMSDEKIYMISSDVSTSISKFSTTALYFVIAEMLVLKYLEYLQKLKEKE